jgi:hypothetical protein
MRKLKYVKLFENFMVNENHQDTDKNIVVYKDSEKKEYETSFTYKIINRDDENFNYYLENAKKYSSKHGIPVKYLDQSDSLLIIFNSYMGGVLMGKFNKCNYHGQYDGWIPGNQLASKTYGEFDTSSIERAEFIGFVFESDLKNFKSKNKLEEYNYLKDTLEKCGIKIIEK